MTTHDDDYQALRETVGAVWLDRDVVRVSGPDAIGFLQGQLSQDVAGLAPGASALSFLLQPQGKVEALLRVTRTGADEVVLDTDGGWGEAVVARLDRFKLRVKCELEPLAWTCLALRGPDSHGAGASVAGDVLLTDADWPGLAGVDLLGEEVPVPPGVRRCDNDAYQAVRIEAGVTTMGAELTEKTIPAETGLVDRATSFTKGCYTGQELVARIDSRGGNVPRRLRGVVVATSEVLPVGASVEVGGKEVGRLTSVGLSPGRKAVVALAYIRREIAPDVDAIVRWGGGEAEARVEALPLVS